MRITIRRNRGDCAGCRGYQYIHLRLFWGGTPARALNIFLDRRASLLISHGILEELERKLSQSRFQPDLIRTGNTVQQILDDLVAAAEIVDPGDVPEQAVRDRKDRMILACAIGGRAGVIVSGDKDLTTLGQYESIPILTAAQFLSMYTLSG